MTLLQSLRFSHLFVQLSSVLLFGLCFHAHAQLSGAVNLGGGTVETSAGSSEQGANSAKQILVIGIGATPESAEKQAITDAVRQAVGAYVDANTIVENEAVIKDRILSVSNGFVKEYKVVSPAKQRDDGLYELQILATVQTGQVVQVLKENNLISGEVAGANMWAEASTKVMNAQDAVAMLQTKMPELIKSSVTITPLGEDGKPMLLKDGTPNTAPASVKEDAATGKATLIWYLEMGLDKKYYRETLLPLVQKCMDAITGVSAKEVSASTQDLRKTSDGGYLEESIFASNGQWRLLPDTIKVASGDYNASDGVTLIKSLSRSFDSYEALFYSAPSRLSLSGDPGWRGQPTLAEIEVKLLDSNRDTLARTKMVGWQPFFFKRNAVVVGPNLLSPYFIGTRFAAPTVAVATIDLDLSLLKEVKTVEISLEVPDFTLSLGNN
jgi:hypothetical protein